MGVYDTPTGWRAKITLDGKNESKRFHRGKGYTRDDAQRWYDKKKAKIFAGMDRKKEEWRQQLSNSGERR